MTQTLEVRRSTAEAKLGKLRSQRGKAVLAGKTVDGAEIDALENELTSLNEAVGERAKAKRAEAQLEYTKRLAEKRHKLAAKEKKRLEAIADAEVATRTLVEAIGRVLRVSEDMGKLAHDISGGPVPTPLQHTDVATRFGGRLASIMGTLPGHQYRLGSVEWRGGSFYTLNQNWREAEEKLLTGHLSPLLKEQKDNGKN